MKRLIGAVCAFTFIAVLATPPAHAGAVQTRFTGGVGLFNPCNAETFGGTGPVKIAYLESADATHFVVHFTMKVATAPGSLGNEYVLSFEANGQFDAPSGTGVGFYFFDVPVHSEMITRGGAANFDLDLGIRVFVVAGVPTGALFIGPATTECHG